MRPIFLLLALSVLASTATAQVIETPVPFDSAGRIVSVDQSLVTRLGLSAPAWPVTGQFAEARLYQVNTGGHTLVVTRPGGALERFSLDDARAGTLRVAFAEGIARAGRVVAEDAASTISEQARGPFVRDQMVLAAAMYGPALASLSNDGATGTGLYMLTVGGTFFALNDFARRRSVTKAQNSLTTDGALRGWAATGLATSMLNMQLSRNEAAMTVLVGGIGGSLVGYHRGRNLTHSEAQAAMTGSTLGAGAVLGTAAAAGLIGDDIGSERRAAAAVLAGGLAGYIVGPAYPRQAGYTVTAGDVSLVRLGAIIGTVAALTPFSGVNDLGMNTGSGIATIGWVGGAMIADRIAAKPFNHSIGDSRMIYLGALGGALMGTALPLMARAESAPVWMTMITGGAIAGSIATQRMMAPARDGSLIKSPSSGFSNARIEIQPEGALMAATGQRGNHSLLRIRF
jgi:hypothetical protein